MITFRISARPLISGLCLLITFASAYAGTSNEIRRTVITEKETLSLADLIEGQNIPDTPIFGAPAPGENGTVKVARILSAARKLSIIVDAPADFGEILITRKSRQVTESDLRSALERELIKTSGNPKFEFNIDTSEKTLERQIESTATAPVEIRSLKLNTTRTRFQAVAFVPDSRLMAKQPIEITGSLTPLNLVYVATRDIERDSVLRQNDFREEYKSFSEAEPPPSYTVTPRGMVAKRAFKAGETIPAGDLAVEIQVEKNATVLVRYERAGLTISMRGKALQSGAMGDVVSVLNQQSKRSIDGVVTGRGIVLVKPETLTNLAANTQ